MRRRFLFVFALPMIIILVLLAVLFLYASVFVADGYHHDSIPSAPQIQFLVVTVALYSVFSSLLGYIAYRIRERSFRLLIPFSVLIGVIWSIAVAVSISLASYTVQPYRGTSIFPPHGHAFEFPEPDPIPGPINTTKELLGLSKVISFFLLPYSICALIYVKKRRISTSR